MSLSIAIPIYNEVSNLENTYNNLIKAIKIVKLINYEIINLIKAIKIVKLIIS